WLEPSYGKAGSRLETSAISARVKLSGAFTGSAAAKAAASNSACMHAGYRLPPRRVKPGLLDEHALVVHGRVALPHGRAGVDALGDAVVDDPALVHVAGLLLQAVGRLPRLFLLVLGTVLLLARLVVVVGGLDVLARGLEALGVVLVLARLVPVA